MVTDETSHQKYPVATVKLQQFVTITPSTPYKRCYLPAENGIQRTIQIWEKEKTIYKFS